MLKCFVADVYFLKRNWIYFILIELNSNLMNNSLYMLNVHSEHFYLLDLEFTCAWVARENAVSFFCGVVVHRECRPRRRILIAI